MSIFKLRAVFVGLAVSFFVISCGKDAPSSVSSAQPSGNDTNPLSSSADVSSSRASIVSSSAVAIPPSEVSISSTSVITGSQPSSSVQSISSQVSSVTSAQSSSSSLQPDVIAQSAIDIVHSYCTSCHFGTHESWQAYTTAEQWLNAQNAQGVSYIDELDPENSLLLKRMTFYGGKQSDMPMDNANQTEAFTASHYKKVFDWVRSLGALNNQFVGDGSVELFNVSFDESGFNFDLTCSDKSAQLLDVVISDPLKSPNAVIATYDAIKVREQGVSFVSVDDLAISQEDGSFWLTGEGIDIWESSVFFNALSKPVADDDGINVTLDIHEVTGLKHEFAKVGLLVSNTDDLSGELVFVHWAGNHGLAEDSGEAKLNRYRQILKNENTAVNTPLPVRLKVVYENHQLKVGGCFDCKEPALGLPKEFNFKPKRIYVVASSHDISALQARVSLTDGYADQGMVKAIHSSPVDCSAGIASISVPANILNNLERLVVEVQRDGIAVASSPAVKAYSSAASCRTQNQLLEPKLRRLSELQIRNSITDIFGDIFIGEVWPSLEDGAKLIGMNSTSDKLNINNINFERLVDFSEAITEVILASHIEVSSCVQHSSSQCVMPLISAYGQRLWRRPLSGDELSSFEAALESFASNKQKLGFALNALTLSSNFLFRSEIGVLLERSKQYQLTNFEVISILSYAVVNSTPDDELLALAAQNQLLSQQQLKEQVIRLFQSSKANQAAMNVYKDYLKLDLVLSRPKDEVFEFTPQLRGDLLESAELMLTDNVEKNLPFTEVFAGSDFFVNKNTARLFGVDYRDEAHAKVNIDGTERFGLFNHPAFLSVHSTLSKSGIVKRGVFTLEQLLCQELPDPPGDVMPVPVPEGIDPDRTSERELLQLTHSAQAACVGCHQVIDPAGFGFENFDSIGRYRIFEKGDVQIDSSGVMDNIGDHILSYGTSAEFSRALIDSPQLKSCASTRFLESFLGQDLTPSACEASKYSELLSDSDATVRDLLLSLIQLESFSLRELK